MQKKPPTQIVTRKPRADGLRNRGRILEVARLAFVEDGASATMDDIAGKAGIGSGTLYRHFPTREILIEAVYKDEVEKLIGAGQRFLATTSPLDALRGWMLSFIDYVASKRLILPALDTVAGGSTRLMQGSHESIHTTFLALIQNAKVSGSLKADLDANDMVRALLGVFHTTALPGWESSARRIVDILIDGTLAKNVLRETSAR